MSSPHWARGHQQGEAQRNEHKWHTTFIYMSNRWLLTAATLIMGLRDISGMLNFDPTMA